MNIKSSAITMLINPDNNQAQITLTTANTHQLKVDVAKLKEILANGKELSVEIKQYRKKKSIDANGYLWVLCQKIAEYMKLTKESVYKSAIRDVGQFQIVPIKNEAAERWIEIWGSKGLGWFAEILEDSKLTGYQKIISYYGSSVYDSREMSVLIDYVIQDAKALGIETKTPKELALLKSEWR